MLDKTQYVGCFNPIKTKLANSLSCCVSRGQGIKPTHCYLVRPSWSTRGSPQRSRECQDTRTSPSGQTYFSKVSVSFVLKLESIQFPPEKKRDVKPGL